MWETHTKSLNLACYKFWEGVLLDILLDFFFWTNDDAKLRQTGLPFVRVPCYKFWQRFRNLAQAEPKPLIADSAHQNFGKRSVLQFLYFEMYGRIDCGRKLNRSVDVTKLATSFSTILSIPSGAAQQPRFRFGVRDHSVIAAVSTNRSAAFQPPSALASTSRGLLGKEQIEKGTNC